ncbi:EAL domain-containing protein [Acinetobacter sp. YH12097]|uniref:sensor domain-containing protein n=1 Tax=Acinetobacter sp. YH12097 TaxID=2601086 RepID=UPI0015D27E97|nr:EAL domain-containing protein [Acinetobacter sp. YH12097]
MKQSTKQKRIVQVQQGIDLPINLFQKMPQAKNIQLQHNQCAELREKLNSRNQMLDASVDCIKLLSLDGHILHMNRAGCLALGVSPTETEFGMSWHKLLPEEVRDACLNAFAEAKQGKTSRFVGMSQVADEPMAYWDNMLSPVFNEYGQVKEILCVSRDITVQRLAENKLQRIIEQDDLTGLLNRRAFSRVFKSHLRVAREHQQQLGLLLIDLDYFKHINDTLGHSAGDHLLHTLGQRFQHCFDANIVVSRLGGDEFAISIPNLKSQQQLTDIASIACQQMDMPIFYNGQSINIGMSIGCAIYPRDAQNTSNLLKCADIALNDLKSSGRGGVRMFNHTMFKILENTTRQLTLARSLIKSNQIIPFYQPKVRLSDSQVVGFEALLRWYDKDQQLQLPSQIFAAFQDYELASRISETMQIKIFQDIQKWIELGLQPLPISINAAPVEFLRDDYAEKLLNRLKQFGISPDIIEVEITEQSLSERGSNYVIRALNLLKDHGIHISLDDFGTGHSSLTRLSNYPVDCIKIDRNFVERMHTDCSALAIVKAITQIGASVSLNILVEGIEKPEQVDTLKECNCHTGQGFYFYRPLSYDHAMELLSH